MIVGYVLTRNRSQYVCVYCQCECVCVCTCWLLLIWWILFIAWTDQIGPFCSRDLPKERESREVTSSSGVPSIKSQSVCASVVQDCFFLCFLCHLAGVLVNEGLSFIGGKERKLGNELFYILSFGDVKMNCILWPCQHFCYSFSQAKLSLLKIRVANVDEVFSSTLDAQIDYQKSNRTQQVTGYLLDWLTLNVFSCQSFSFLSIIVDVSIVISFSNLTLV